MTETQENTYFGKFQDGEIVGGEDFLPEDFICCKGTVLVVVPPPKKMTEGGLHLPERSLESPSVGRVAAVPKDDPLCPVKPGDWIVTRHLEGQPVSFGKRGDLRIVQFSNDHQTEILGYFEAEKYNEALERVASQGSTHSMPTEEFESALKQNEELIISP